MLRFAGFVLTVLMAMFPLAKGFATDSGNGQLKTVNLKAGQQVIRAEVAETEAERGRGLMYRKSLPENGGMLFVYGAPVRTCMWMKNTAIPLSVAFIDRNGVILNIEEMKPFTTDSHCSEGWVYYALEMNAGWFAKNGLVPGSRIERLLE